MRVQSCLGGKTDAVDPVANLSRTGAPRRSALAVAALSLLVTNQARADQHTKEVAKALLEFETAIPYSEVQPSWKKTRPAWLKQVEGANTAAAVAKHILQLEESMKWESVAKSWKARRDGWRQALGRAHTNSEAAHGLLELEAETKWDAVDANWKQRRPDWLKELKMIAGEK